MGKHDDYGKAIVRDATNGRCKTSQHRSSCDLKHDDEDVRYGFIDCTIDDEIAVEIESRVEKQVRGAIFDLINHPYPKKLLLLVPTDSIGKDKKRAADRASKLLAMHLAADRFQVVLLQGTGDDQQSHRQNDLTQVKAAVAALR